MFVNRRSSTTLPNARDRRSKQLKTFIDRSTVGRSVGRFVRQSTQTTCADWPGTQLDTGLRHPPYTPDTDDKQNYDGADFNRRRWRPLRGLFIYVERGECVVVIVIVVGGRGGGHPFRIYCRRNFFCTSAKAARRQRLAAARQARIAENVLCCRHRRHDQTTTNNHHGISPHLCSAIASLFTLLIESRKAQ
ncbi:unnamed protein product [Soboliphyme baturini]|uniref:Uncharacterized protein n=1 Tax=Soboliphyme baturini TaxID=241478 RepID=A0A183IB24_9BILA|nr:unnamed protein product [Soboliphyme baturini]